MSRPRLLDLFCGAGGAAMGYHQAGFDVVGVDIAPQPHYPFEFHQADALEWLGMAGMSGPPLDGFDAIHASPPCQHFAKTTKWRGSQADHPDLLTPTLARLVAVPVPWVVENVPGAPLRADYLLCGGMFGLRVRRHRLLQTSWYGFALAPACHHIGMLPFIHKGERAFADAMGCDWMTNGEAREAIPPAYTRFIGEALLAHLGVTA